MRVRTLGYFFQQALRSMLRNFWMSVASVATVAISLIVLGAFVLLIANTNYIAQKVESDVEIAVFLLVDTPEEEVNAVGEGIRAIPGVAEVELIPKEEGLQQLSRQFGREHDLIRALGGKNPLPDYYIVKAENPKKVPSIAEAIETMPNVEKVNYGQGVVEKLFSLARWIRVGGIITIGLLAVCTVFLIAITIRLTIFARKKEINIMKFVGATDWFIHWPFFIEGMFLGLLGSLMACVALYFSYIFLVEQITATFSFLPVLKDVSVLRKMLLIVLAVGPLVGALGSLLSLRKFLQV